MTSDALNDLLANIDANNATRLIEREGYSIVQCESTLTIIEVIRYPKPPKPSTMPEHRNTNSQQLPMTSYVVYKSNGTQWGPLQVLRRAAPIMR